jgi:hypothetical protein
MSPGRILSDSTKKTRKSRLERVLALPGWVYILCALASLAVALAVTLIRYA